MTLEEKRLLLIDLCGRLPYRLKVKCERYPFPVTVLYAGNINEVKFKETGGIERIDIIKPYLRPMSSMNSKEWVEYCDACVEDEKSWVWAGKEYKFTPVTHREEFLNSHHFDYRGLIPMGLALEAKEGMYG